MPSVGQSRCLSSMWPSAAAAGTGGSERDADGDGGAEQAYAQAHRAHSAGCAARPPVEHGLVDAGRQRPRPLELAEQRQDDQEVDEVVERRELADPDHGRGRAPGRRPRSGARSRSPAARRTTCRSGGRWRCAPWRCRARAATNSTAIEPNIASTPASLAEMPNQPRNARGANSCSYTIERRIA